MDNRCIERRISVFPEVFHIGSIQFPLILNMKASVTGHLSWNHLREASLFLVGGPGKEVLTFITFICPES
jgi:hypothetical protein